MSNHSVSIRDAKQKKHKTRKIFSMDLDLSSEEAQNALAQMKKDLEQKESEKTKSKKGK